MLAKGDWVIQSKHADYSFRGREGFALFWLDTPKKGKCLSVRYFPGDFPAVTVVVTANHKARTVVRQYERAALMGVSTYIPARI